MTDKFVQRGDVIDYTNGGSAISSGDVVEMSGTLGVALTDIANGDTGAVAIEGVFTLPKVSAAVFAVGEKLIWDTSAGAFDDSSATPASGDITGAAVAIVAGANTETTCTVKLTPGNTTLTP
jgi:predicted RecA/RadA family phage recombinase